MFTDELKDCQNSREEIFHRTENKYILTREQFEIIVQTVDSYMQPDIYSGPDGTYSIISLYYDTPHNELIRTSMNRPKPVYKEKLRVRSYGVPQIDEPVFIEIKKKINGFGDKRRSSMVLSDFYNFIKSGELPELTGVQAHPQVLFEISAMIIRYGGTLVPQAILSYNRMAFNGHNDKDLRVSFDKNFKGRMHDLKLENGGYGDILLSPDFVIMEVKVLASMPLWLVRLLSSCGVYSRGYSKIAVSYKNSLLNGVKELMSV